jgi:hypothetical protein
MIILMSFFKKENPSVYGQHSISLQNILGLQSSINISSYFIILPANLSLVYFVGQ